jgi:hypothetical protein
MSDIKAVLNSDNTITAVLQNNGSIAKSFLTEGTVVKAMINNGVSIYNRINGGLYIHFDVTENGTEQLFVSPDLTQYNSVNDINLMKNGVYLEPTLFVKTAADTIRVDVYLTAGDSIDILATGSANFASGAAGSNTQVQYNHNDELAGSPLMSFDDVSGNLTVTRVISDLVGNVTGNVLGDLTGNVLGDLTGNVLGNLSGNVTGDLSGNVTGDLSGNVTGNANLTSLTTTSANLGAVGNLHISGGSANYVLKTNGSGTLSWGPQTGGGGNGSPGGSNGQIQFNNLGSFDGLGNLTIDTTGNAEWGINFNSVLHLGNLSASSGNWQVISMDSEAGIGKGLSQVRATYFDIYTYSAARTYGYAGIEQTSFDPIAVTWQNHNIAAGRVAFNDAWFEGAGGVDGTVELGRANGLRLIGGTQGQVLTKGTGNTVSFSNIAVGSNTQIQFNNANALGASANLTFDTATGTFSTATANINTRLNALADVKVQRAYEKVTANATAATGTLNFDMLTQSIEYRTSNIIGDITLNLRGNSTVTMNNSLAISESVTIAFINTVGTTPYVVSQLQIDGSNVTPKYVNGYNPTTGTKLANAVQSYTYTLLKTAANTYTVLGSLTEYQ